ncbi:hypothetical protein G6514_001628 [Epicoccum nigrum]|nr:hypothetical protein G6514_001628 [Epicoccum nigrum]
MIWLTKLIVTLLAITNDYVWLVIDPVASLALAEAKCTLPAYSCLLKAKSIHLKLIREHIDDYWCKVKEESDRSEHERKEKEACDRYLAAQLEKADRWDRWEMSPPTHTTIVNNYNYFDHPTFVATSCPPPPTTVPGVNVKDLAMKHRPTIDSELRVDAYAMEIAMMLITITSFMVFVAILYIAY